MEENKTFDFYNEYVKVKSDQLITEIDDLIHDMQVMRCNVRHYKVWETRVQTFKNDYRIFHKNLLQRVNSEENEAKARVLEEQCGDCCVELEKHYAVLAEVFMEKRNEIERKTTYFDVKKQSSIPHFLFVSQAKIKNKIQIMKKSSVKK